MITIRYTFDAGQYVATLYLDAEPIETRTFNSFAVEFRGELDRWAHTEGCTTIEPA